MSVFKCLNAAVALCFASNLMAEGIESSGGGKAVVCYNSANAIQSVELYDFWEARELFGLTIDLGDASLSVNDKVSLAISRIPMFDGFHRKKLRELADRFLGLNGQTADTVYLNARLPTVDDAGIAFEQEGCVLEQAAMQRRGVRTPLDKTFVVSNRLWSSMGNDTKAGLVLHEIIYYIARTWEWHSDSVSSRQWLALLGANQLSSMDEAGYKALFDSLKIYNTPFNREIRQGGVTQTFFVSTDDWGNSLRDYVHLPILEGVIEIRVCSRADLFPDGILRAYKPWSETYDNSLRTHIHVKFDADGCLREVLGCLDHNCKIPTAIGTNLYDVQL